MQTMKNRQQQRGATLVGMLVIIAILGLGLYSVIRLLPAYMEYYAIVRAMEATAKDSPAESTSPGELRTALQRRWDIDDIKSLDVADMDIKKISTGYEMTADYEARVPFVANVSWLVAFNKTVNVN